MYSADRLRIPRIRRDGTWQDIAWENALETAADWLKRAVEQEGPERIGFLGSPSATSEELYLLARIARGLGSNNVDTRLRQTDFSDPGGDPAYPGLGLALRDVDSLNALLLVGCQARDEAPIFAHRVRQAALRGCRVSLLSTAPQQCHFPLFDQTVVGAADLVGELAAAAQGRVAESLAAGGSAIVLGGVAMRHSRFADLRAAAQKLAHATGATLGYLTDGANAAGAALAGALPHRGPGGKPVAKAGLDAAAMSTQPLAACVLFGGIEPEHDLALPDAPATLRSCARSIAITPYAGASVESSARLLLPMGTFAETAGTYVNAEGRWQEFRGCAQPVGDARPGWKILRVLGNLLGLPGFDYESAADVLAELKRVAGEVRFDGRATNGREPRAGRGGSTSLVPIYAVDAIVRRSAPLQQTRQAREAPAAGA